jgi:hypothetical protein
MLTLSGLRIGTLVKLTYFLQVRKDLKAGIIPVHLHIDATITKGNYHSYNMFLGFEAVQCLKTYLDIRKKGTVKIPRAPC